MYLTFLLHVHPPFFFRGDIPDYISEHPSSLCSLYFLLCKVTFELRIMAYGC